MMIPDVVNDFQPNRIFILIYSGTSDDVLQRIMVTKLLEYN